MNNIANLMEFLREWLRYYLIFPKAVFFIWGLILVHSWVEYAVVALLITYLADPDIMHLPKATSIVNMLDGMAAVLMLVNAYFSETYLGPFLDLLCTNTSYIAGLLFFYLGLKSSPSEGINKQLVYVAVILIGLGQAGRDIQLKEFLADQCRREGPGEDEDRVESRRKIWWRSAYILGIIASVFLFVEVPTKELCKISLISMAIALVLFFLGYAFYYRRKPAKSNLHNILRVLYVSATGRLQRHPLDYHGAIVRALRVFSTWLDPTAVEDQTEQGHPIDYDAHIWTSRVADLKSLLKMLPLWSTFLVYGLLLATANTFFYVQTDYTANYLGPIPVFSDIKQADYSCNDDRMHISGRVQVPVIIFVIIRYLQSFAVSRLCDLVLWLKWGKNIPRLVMLVRSGVGLAVSPICCFVAWRIEEYRLHQRMDHYICLRFTWLIPQFILLGLMEGLVLDAMENIFVSVVPQSLSRYGPPFTLFALNIGHFTGLLFLAIFRNLIQEDLNFSRLGVYYRNLGYVCLVNLVMYCCVAPYYPKQETSDPNEAMEQPLEDIHNLQHEETESVGVQ